MTAKALLKHTAAAVPGEVVEASLPIENVWAALGAALALTAAVSVVGRVVKGRGVLIPAGRVKPLITTRYDSKNCGVILHRLPIEALDADAAMHSGPWNTEHLVNVSSMNPEHWMIKTIGYTHKALGNDGTPGSISNPAVLSMALDSYQSAKAGGARYDLITRQFGSTVTYRRLILPLGDMLTVRCLHV